MKIMYNSKYLQYKQTKYMCLENVHKNNLDFKKLQFVALRMMYYKRTNGN